MFNDPQMIVLYVFVFASSALMLSAVIGAGREAHQKKVFANKREKEKDRSESPEELLAKMRRDRGLDRAGYLNNMNYHMGRLVTQSGLPLGPNMIYPIIVVSALACAFFGFLWMGSVVWAVLGGAGGVVLPPLILQFIVNRRRDKAAKQLPDALDVIIRSLKAGHPVPVALSLVGREMPDPIGSEFGMASDEISFGGSVSAAIQRMADRIGQDDFDLFAAMIRLQEKTGGNLAELLEGNAATIRGRQRLRLKVRAASAEGRASALILNAAPIGLFFVVKTMAPDFYGDVDDNALMQYAFYGIAGWMLIGNMVMRKMINFRV